MTVRSGGIGAEAASRVPAFRGAADFRILIQFTVLSVNLRGKGKPNLVLQVGPVGLRCALLPRQGPYRVDTMSCHPPLMGLRSAPGLVSMVWVRLPAVDAPETVVSNSAFAGRSWGAVALPIDAQHPDRRRRGAAIAARW